jgi:hypothetical protein
MRLSCLVAALLVASAAQAAGLRDALANYQTAIKQGDAALQTNDITAAKRAYEAARDLEPQIPLPYLKLAKIAVRSGDKAGAIKFLGSYAAMHKLLDLDSDFAALKGAPGYAALAAYFKLNAAPLCRCSTIWRGKPDDFFIAEGLANDSAKDRPRFFVASVKTRRIVIIENHRRRDFATLPGRLAPFGIFAARGRLLVAAAELRPGGAPPREDGLLVYDLKTGALLQRIDGPHGVQLGDLALAPDGTIYLSGSNGALLRLTPNGRKLEELSRDFISPQGMVVSADGRTLLVADYAAGLMLFDPATRKLTPVDVPRGLTTITMDGLARLADGSFVATQNNIAPVRIVHLALSKDWSRLIWMKLLAVNDPKAGDPSLITTDGNKVYAVGVAQWLSLADNGRDLKPPLHPWQILELRP